MKNHSSLWSPNEAVKNKIIDKIIKENKNNKINIPLSGSFANVCTEFKIPDLTKKVPIILEHNGQYLCYGLKGGKEESKIVDTTSDSSKLYSPIIRIKSLPKTLKPGNGTLDRYQPIELEDISSLAKLTWGFDEIPFPLFLFPHNDKWLLGVFMNFNDEGTSYYCHVVLNNDPKKPFLKFSSTNGIEPTFVENPSEHGYSYIKIIKLKETHPLVDYGHLQN